MRIRALVHVLFSAVGLLTILGAAGPAVAAVPTDLEERCRELIPADIQQPMDADAAWVFAAEPAVDWPAEQVPFAADAEQLACYWYVPSTDTPPFGMAYVVVSDDVSAAAVAGLEALGYTQEPMDAGVLLTYTAPIDSMEAEWRASSVYLIGDGYLVRGSTLLLATAVAAALAPESTSAPVPVPVPAPTSDALDTPSIFSELPTVQGIQVTATGTVVLVAGVAIFVGVVAWPGKLLESAVAERYGRLTRPFAPVRTVVARFTPVTRRVPRLLALALAVALAALITSFLDPGFGTIAASPRIFLSQILALAGESLVGLLLVGAILRRSAGVESRLDIKAGSLLLVALAVLLSRAVGLHPGLVLGVLIGLAFTVELGRARERLVAILEVGYLLLAGIAAWLVYSGLVAAGVGGLVGTFLVEFFAGLAVAALSALPVALLPLGRLPGAILFAANRVGWAVGYAIATVLMLLVLLPLPASWESIETPLVVWFVAYAAYGIVAVLGVLALRRWVAPDHVVDETRQDLVAS